MKFRQAYERTLDGVIIQIGCYAHASYQRGRNSVEPIIGQMKHNGLLDRSTCGGREGDLVSLFNASRVPGTYHSIFAGKVHVDYAAYMQ